MSDEVKDAASVLDPATGLTPALASALQIASVAGKLRAAHQTKQKSIRVGKMVESLGTPGDYAKALMKKSPPKEWEASLREISPVTETASHLVFAWKGPPLDVKSGRWCLYEAIPDALISVERRMELETAPYWRLPPSERHGQALVVSAYQWQMYRRYRLDVRPFWCLQGSEGGTPFHYDATEKRFLRMMGKPDTPPELGALPYTGWDSRVRDAVLARDRLAKLGGSVERMRGTATTAALLSARDEREKDYRRAFWDHFTARMGPTTELYAWILKHEPPDRKRQTEAEHRAASDAREIFIETGRVPDPIEYRKRRIAVAT